VLNDNPALSLGLRLGFYGSLLVGLLPAMYQYSDIPWLLVGRPLPCRHFRWCQRPHARLSSRIDEK
jgi:hypothetical protein